ncbi:hypothetical protein Hanom_Chr16g01431881 [Helianthus anomalus]
MTRYVHEIHYDVESTDGYVDHQKQHACLEPGCGKVFKYICIKVKKARRVSSR